MDSLELKPIRRTAGKVRLPGSKSISNRVLLLAALASGDTEVSGLLDADDTRVMRDALSKLGVRFSKRRVRGAGGPFPVKKAELFLGNAGTALRPLTAALVMTGGEYRLAGAPRMHRSEEHTSELQSLRHLVCRLLLEKKKKKKQKAQLGKKSYKMESREDKHSVAGARSMIRAGPRKGQVNGADTEAMVTRI